MCVNSITRHGKCLSILQPLSYEVDDCLSLPTCPATQCNEAIRIDSMGHTSPVYKVGELK